MEGKYNDVREIEGIYVRLNANGRYEPVYAQAMIDLPKVAEEC